MQFRLMFLQHAISFCLIDSVAFSAIYFKQWLTYQRDSSIISTNISRISFKQTYIYIVMNLFKECLFSSKGHASITPYFTLHYAEFALYVKYARA